MFEYISFFEQVGDLEVVKNANSSKKIYDVLAIRKLYQETSKNYINPLDEKIKDLICDCYTKNNSQPFSADSKIIRDCLDKGVPKLIKNSKIEYTTMLNKMKKDENLMKLTEQERKKIEKLKYDALIQMKNELTKRKIKIDNTTVN